MTLLVRVEVTPFYGQVEISDPSKRDYPQFETGQERVVAIPECIAVVTRGDFEGKVRYKQMLWMSAPHMEAAYPPE